MYVAFFRGVHPFRGDTGRQDGRVFLATLRLAGDRCPHRSASSSLTIKVVISVYIRSNRETHRRQMAHHRVTGGNLVPSARFPHEPFPHLLCWLRCPVEQGSFYPDVRVSSVYIHDTQNGLQQVIREVETGWVHQAVVTHAAFKRVPRKGKPYFHINNHDAKKSGNAKNVLLTVRTVMYQEQIDMVAGDFDGAAWRKWR